MLTSGYTRNKFEKDGVEFMKVTVERSAVLKSLSHVYRVVERRNTIPILSNVLLKASGGELNLKATDLDLEITESCVADVNVAGGITVPAHFLYEIVRKLPDGAHISLEIEPGETQMLLRSGRSRFHLQALPVDDFPDLTIGELPHEFSVPAQQFKALIDRTQFAISTEETRYYLNGIYLHTMEADNQTKLRAVATDGHRLARMDMTLPQGAQTMPGVIIPRKTVAELQKLLEGMDGDIQVAISTSKIRLKMGKVILTSKLIDGTFPDYQRVIPVGNDKFMRVDRTLFAAAVDRVSTISSERGRAVKLALDTRKLTLSVVNPDSGSATEEIEVDYAADAIEVGFNARYVLDIMGQLTSETAVFAFADPGAPTIIQDDVKTGDIAAALYVLMPMRV
jgi:DNA polymerase III subunit beta